MVLVSGSRVGPYQIVGLIGAGGMGEVYRGHDPRLGRDVAIKVLPSDFSNDPERLVRFELEARAAAALNHPNILAVYDIGQQNGAPYIVSELLEGETLRARLQKPASATQGSSVMASLPVRKALEYATQIAHGLAAAHEKGIVHRDLKPENIFVSDKRVKILDFGLAKLTQPDRDADDNLPTAAPDTRYGTVMGTVGYMSPEQVRGQSVEHRSDIFSFGAILYEMLSGHRAFRGASSADTMTAILQEDPPALSASDPHITPGLARVVDRCLEKNPDARFQSTQDLAFALDGLMGHSDVNVPVVASRTRPSTSRWLPWALVAGLSAALIAAAWLALSNDRRPRAQAQAVRFELTPPGYLGFGPSTHFVSVSPDGTRIVFSATWDASPVMLFVRALDSLAIQRLAGTEGGRNPFWSPDGRSIAFFADRKLKKVPAGGGAVETIVDTSGTQTGGTWNREGVILLSAFLGPIRRVSAMGGATADATSLDTSKRHESHGFPQFLPDGRTFLYYAHGGNREHDGIYARSLDKADDRLVARGNSNCAYVEPGYLVFAREGVLMAQPFDATRIATTGDAFPIAERVEQFAESGNAAFAASASGVLVYRSSADAALSRLVWVDRTGRQLGQIGEPGLYRNPRLSPDGTRVVAEMVDKSGGRDIWIIDVARTLSTRFTFDGGRNASPVWSPDGRSIAWQGNSQTLVKPSSGAGKEQSLRPEPWIPDEWLPDDKGLLYHPGQPRQVWLLPLNGEDRTPRPVIEGRDITTHARVSPDGRWVAFATQEPGRFEVFVQNFPTPVGRWQVSTGGGIQPKWRSDGKELFYLALDGSLMSVPVTLGDTFERGSAAPLFQTRLEILTGLVWHQYDVSRDGQRFLINMPDSFKAPPLTVVVNLPALLKPQP